MAAKHKMTAGEATSFGRYSATNATILASQLTCACQPYEDVFTYQRWQAQGMQVQRGEKGIKLGAYVEFENVSEDDDGNEVITIGKRPWASHVFCRCQVTAKER